MLASFPACRKLPARAEFSRKRGAGGCYVFIKTVQQAKRVIKIVVGFTLLVAGIVMIVTPGPGWLVIALGLATLATEFAWAGRLLGHLKTSGAKLRDAVLPSSTSKAP